MSKVAKNPITVPKGVEVKRDGQSLNVKGPKGVLEFTVHDAVEFDINDNVIQFKAKKNAPNAVALSGTSRAVVSNLVQGVHQGFERKLTLVGVGYRAAVQGKNLNLTLGFSHPVVFPIPEGITIQTPTPTEVVISGIDKQLVGQVAANIRRFRPPEPYKGKGVRYADEVVHLKEGKKK